MRSTTTCGKMNDDGQINLISFQSNMHCAWSFNPNMHSVFCDNTIYHTILLEVLYMCVLSTCQVLGKSRVRVAAQNTASAVS